jgi:multicomponent Na+:H+ antiporter subunit E
MRVLRPLMLFVVLLGFWQALSARVDPLFITIGVVSSAAVTVFTLRLIEAVVGPADRAPRLSLLHLISFLAWLLTRIPPAGLQVALVVLDPRRPPRPGVVHFRTGLASPAARTLLANAITLVPGTITINVTGDEFTVHAFTPESVGDLASAEAQSRIARAFRVPPDEPPLMIWEPVHDELPAEDPT